MATTVIYELRDTDTLNSLKLKRVALMRQKNHIEKHSHISLKLEI